MKIESLGRRSGRGAALALSGLILAGCVQELKEEAQACADALETVRVEGVSEGLTEEEQLAPCAEFEDTAYRTTDSGERVSRPEALFIDDEIEAPRWLNVVYLSAIGAIIAASKPVGKYLDRRAERRQTTKPEDARS